MDLFTVEACLQPDGPARPTFCNVPVWGQLFIYVAGLLAVAVFAYGIYRHWRAWKAGQPNAPSRNTGNAGKRAVFALKYALGQRATIDRRLPAVFHSGIFYGFVILTIGTALATIDWDVFHLFFDTQFLVGSAYNWYELAMDTFGFLFVVGLLIAMYRRYIVKPHHVIGAWDFVIWSLLIINVTGFLVEGFRLVIAPVEWGMYSWVGQGIANLFGGASEAFVTGAAADLHLGLWMIHAIAAVVFIAAIPFTNAVHMVSTAANATLKTVGPTPPGAALEPIDIENAEFFGVSNLGEFNWKQRLGFDSCLSCGRCETVCPAFMCGTPLNPKGVISGLSLELRTDLGWPGRGGPAKSDTNGNGSGASAEAADAAAAQMVVGEGLTVEPGALWGCTTCLACVEVCPAFIEIVDDIVDMRRYLTLTEGAVPGTGGVSLRNMTTSGNPWGYAQEDRLSWADGLEVPVAQAGEHYEVLYWVGCSAAYDQRNQKIARAMARLLNASGVKYAVMREERCHCESARRIGDEYLYQTAAEENVANMAQYTFDRLLAPCPHCFNTLKNEYPEFGGEYDVVHHTQLLQELVADGRLTGLARDGQRVAFHDSCYLARYNRVFDEPRSLLSATGASVVELERNRENGLCCGGGGGKMWFEDEQFETKVEIIRMQEALASKPDAVGVSCPFCLTMLDGAAKDLDAPDLPILDVAEIMAAGLPEYEPANEAAEQSVDKHADEAGVVSTDEPADEPAGDSGQ